MSYTKGQLIDQIYLRVNGGKATSQNTVKRIDIEFYAMAAINTVWGNYSKESMDMAIRAKRAGLPYQMPDFSTLHTSEVLTPLFDTSTNLFYISVPMIKTIGSWEVAPVEGFEQIYKIGSRSELQGLDTGGLMYAYYQRQAKSEQRIYFINLPASCGVLFSTSQNLNDLGNDDILPIPSDKEEFVIQASVEFFTGEKLTPTPIVINQRDIKDKVNAE